MDGVLPVAVPGSRRSREAPILRVLGPVAPSSGISRSMMADSSEPTGCTSLRWISGLVTIWMRVPSSNSGRFVVSCVASQGPGGSEVDWCMPRMRVNLRW